MPNDIDLDDEVFGSCLFHYNGNLHSGEKLPERTLLVFSDDDNYKRTLGDEMRINRKGALIEKDTWLTPPALLKALGKFDLDPCCPRKMPWRTAKKMICLPRNGLEAEWRGRIWCNPPYSDIMPWVVKMAEHGNGILLVPAKSTDSRWGQLVLKTAKAVIFQKGRILFHYIDGSLSTGKWSPYLLAAYGFDNVLALKQLQDNPNFGGIVMEKI